MASRKRGQPRSYFVGGAGKAKRVEVDGYKFASMAEARRYGQLSLLLMAGQIRNLEVHPRFPLIINGRKIGRRGWYEADFRYQRQVDGEWRSIVEDAKQAVDTDATKVRREVAAAIHMITIDVVKME